MVSAAAEAGAALKEDQMADLYTMAVLEPAEGGGFGVYFPHFDGCISFGHTPVEATRNAEEALIMHIEGMIEDGLPLPQDTELIPEGVHAPKGGYFAVVRAPRPDRVVRANLTFDEGLLQRIDRAAERENTTRSAWLAKAAREALSGKAPSAPDREAMQRVLSAMLAAAPHLQVAARQEAVERALQAAHKDA